MQACDSGQLVALSLLSRLTICLLIVSSTALLTPFDSSHRLVLPADVSAWTASLLRWDVFHFAHIASKGSVYEHQWAFLPAISLVMSWSGSALSFLGFSPPGWPALLHGGALVGVLFDSTCVLYQLSLFHLRSPSAAFLATALSLVSSSPAALRFAPYTEPFYTYFSYRGMLACARSRWLLASLYFTVASAFRSNGILLCGFILWGMLVVPFLSARRDLLSVKRLFYCVALVALPLAPFFYHNYRAYVLFCSSTLLHPAWCEKSMFPSIYSHVQAKYWNVGFLRYWTISNIPNFLLSLPALFTVYAFCGFYLCHLRWIIPHLFPQRLPKANLQTFLHPTILPHVIHGLALTLVLTFNAHVQIALRVLPSVPVVHWAAAWLLIERPRWGKVWIVWSVMWCALSCVLWAVFLPPA
ncbi:glycosyltransferase family 76 protein [Scleroderma yunnanense]